MPHTKIRSTSRTAQKARRVIDSGNQRTKKDGSGKAKRNAVAGARIGFHLLTKHLRQISLFELSLMRGYVNNNNFPGLLKIIDTESKQLQAIEDLYKIVKAQPKYKKLKEPDWNIDTPPVTVLYWLLRKLGPLAEGNLWSIDTWHQGNKTRYRFIVTQLYNAQKVVNREEHIPLDFLPALKKRDEPLHDMIINLVALMSKENKLPLWDNDGDFSEGLTSLAAMNVTTGNETLDKQRQSYTHGPAFEYLKRIKKARKTITVKALQQQVTLYDNNSDRKSVIAWWISKGIELAATGKCIATNTCVYNYITGNPINPLRLYKFVWSLHSNDYLLSQAYSKMKRDDQKWGTFLPAQFSITKPGQVVKKLLPLEMDNYPVMLYDFMHTGVSNFLSRYREYFYKKQMEDTKTPSERLLEQIEQMEIRKLKL